jgi:hypothetical protein
MIAGRGAWICGECVELASEMISEDGPSSTEDPVAQSR